VLGLAVLFATAAGAQGVLPLPEQPFGGRIGITTADSVKDFPKEVEAPKGAPNILVILTDDVGFGASSTFGGPRIGGRMAFEEPLGPRGTLRNIPTRT
jgi:arylsulfatase